MNKYRPLSLGALLLAVLVLTVIWFAPLDMRKLVKPDEGRYAEIPREMVASGDWLTPRLNGIKYFEKPPLQYWATAVAYSAFGQHDWTARLWTALTGFFGILFAAYTAGRLWGRSAALYAGATLASSLLYGLIGHANTLDMGVSVFLSSAIFAFVLAQHDDASPPQTRRWMWCGWLLLALAVLSKGLIGLVLPAATLVVYSLLQRDFAIWKRLHLVSGLLLMLAVSAPWFVAVSRENPEFAHFFFIHEHFERFLTKEHGRYQPCWYFLPILLVGILPWLTLLPGMCADAVRREARRFHPRRFLLLWALVVFVFFSASDSKLASYILPMFPPLAVLLGASLATADPRRLRWHALPYVILGAAGFVAAPEIVRLASIETPAALYEAAVPWLMAACAALALLAMLALILAQRRRRTPAILSLALGSLLCGQLILIGHDSLAPSHSAYNVAQQTLPELKPGMPFYSVDTYDQTLQPYLHRTTTLVVYQDELGFGIKHEPEKFIPSLAEFEKIWRTQPSAMALMTPELYAQYQQRDFPMRLIARDTRRVVVAKPQAGMDKQP